MSLGSASFNISSLLLFSSGPKLASPVILPPGRPKLATRPAPMGSETVVITMGMVVVALLAANADGAPETTIRSTLRQPGPPQAQAGAHLCSANRYSKVIFFLSTQPSLLSSCR